MPTNREEQIRSNLKRLAAIHATAISALEESVAILEAELNALSSTTDTAPDRSRAATKSSTPLVDRSAMSVVYRGRKCFLGNTLMFRFLERLAVRPDHYVSYDDLLNDVWQGSREPSSVRSVVKELRSRLRSAGMSAVADAIDGRVSGHYGLVLSRIK